MFELIKDLQLFLYVSNITGSLLGYLSAFPFFLLGLSLGRRPLYLSVVIAFILVPFVWAIRNVFFEDWGLYVYLYLFIFSILGPLVLVTSALLIPTTRNEKNKRDPFASLMKAAALMWGLGTLYSMLNYVPFADLNSLIDIIVLISIPISEVFWSVNMLLCFFVAQWIVVKLKWNVCPPITIFPKR